MVIESKYDVGQEVWSVWRRGRDIMINKDKLVEIIYNEEKRILYMLSICDDIEEKDVIPLEDTVKLLKEIIRLQEEIDNEERTKNTTVWR